MSPFHFSKIEWKSIKHFDYELGPSYTKEFSLIGKDNVAEKVRVMEKPGLFSKDFKVVCMNNYIYKGQSYLKMADADISKSSESGCKNMCYEMFGMCKIFVEMC